MDLFDYSSNPAREAYAPLAYRMRPDSLEEILGQDHLLGSGAVLRRALEKDQLYSMVFFGPSGTGKTTLAQLIAQKTKSYFQSLPAVTSGAGDIRKVAHEAEQRRKYYQQKTILFVDEIHRFNKSQQDILLPFVENGVLILIGATTENPFYELNHALVSRLQIYILKSLEPDHITRILKNALRDKKRGLGNYDITCPDGPLSLISNYVKGDARMALNILDTLVNSFIEDGRLELTEALAEKALSYHLVKYDKTGSYHYDTISAFIKSIRGSDPDAALFWLAAMLEGGESPEFIVRRMIVHAAEDIGLADPRALTIATAAAAALDYVGMPEARIPIAEAVLYLASAPKSNSTVAAIDKAIQAVRGSVKPQVPLHLSNAPLSFAGEKSTGTSYKYPHSYGGYTEQLYLPEECKDLVLYHPSDNGYEKKIRLFLERLPNNKQR
ncbi:MAG: replication-associated recombination protein A [Syntrophomonadaceae bacterium]|nr:replication-associated recombination protein A [Syntrophomonadaceae bacterium]